MAGMETILVTGGAGYIGSHTCVELLEAGYDVVVVDDLSNGSPRAVTEAADIAVDRLPSTGSTWPTPPPSRRRVQRAPIDGVIHFAGLKAVGESVAEPLRYFRTNLDTR
jgi:UDP-glucose 4-epimerase